MQGMIGATCPFYGLRPYLEPLRPWRDERLVALAIQRWIQRPAPEMVLGRSRPRKYGDRPAVDPKHLRAVARELREVADADPSIGPDVAEGITFFMVRNVICGRVATDDGDVVFDNTFGTPHEKTRRRYQRRWGKDAGRVWAAESFQQDLDIAALVDGGRSPGAARQWLRDNPDKHAKDAPAPRKRRAA